MKNIHHSPSTRNFPDVFIDYDNNIFKIKGRCIMEDAQTFFNDLLDKLSPMDNIKIIIDLEYLNSSSLRHLIFLLRSHLPISEVEWHFEEEDFDVEDKGEDVKHVVLLKKPDIIFILIKKPT